MLPKRRLHVSDRLFIPNELQKENKAPDFEKMGSRKPIINLPSYKDHDSEDEEQRKLDEYFMLNCRPPSIAKRSYHL